MKIHLADQISNWIASLVDKSGGKGAIVGLSGGIDSAVVAKLCQKALGDNVIGVIMPCESSPDDEKHAIQLAKLISLHTETIHLDPVYKSLLKVLPKGSKLAKANLKPRLRMASIYFMAAMHSYLVAGTGNRSEFMTGYFTKYGDGGVDFLPLGNLYKTKVRELARELDLPREIIEKPPSGGLWAGQTDEDELGITYENLDHTLMAIEQDKTDEINPEVLAYTKLLIKHSAHKRYVPPVFNPEFAFEKCKKGNN